MEHLKVAFPIYSIDSCRIILIRHRVFLYLYHFVFRRFCFGLADDIDYFIHNIVRSIGVKGFGRYLSSNYLDVRRGSTSLESAAHVSNFQLQIANLRPKTYSTYFCATNPFSTFQDTIPIERNDCNSRDRFIECVIRRILFIPLRCIAKWLILKSYN